MRRSLYIFFAIALSLSLVVPLADRSAAYAQVQEMQPIVRYADYGDLSQPLTHFFFLRPTISPRAELPRKSLPNRLSNTTNPTDDPVWQQSVSPGAPVIDQNFEGIHNVNFVLPPDTDGDIGPNHYIQIVNWSFAIYNRNGNLLFGPADINTLWNGFGHGQPCELYNDGDPIVLYDHLADRWLISQFVLPFYPSGPFYECIAVSQTSDPLGAWYRYQFKISETKMNDYPKLAVWPDGYYMTINQFSAGTLGWAGAGAIVFERDAMLAGQTNPRMVYFDLYSLDVNLGGMLPSDLDGPPPPAGTPNFFLNFDDDAWGYSPDQLRLYGFQVDWNNPSQSTFNLISTLPTEHFDPDMCSGVRTCIPQPGGVALDALSDRLMFRLQYRNFGSHKTLVTNQTVDVNGFDRAGIRWYELRDSGNGWNIYQQGTFSPDANHRWMGSVAMNGLGEMALGYSVSSTSVSPSIRVTGRLPGDTLGQMAQGEATLMNGSGYQTSTSGRWGDYSSMNVDPIDDCTFWYTNQYYGTISPYGWQTRVGAFRLSSCGGTWDYPPTVIITNPTEGSTVSGTVQVTADANDDLGVTQVQFLLDGVSIGTDMNGTDGWSMAWNTLSHSNGAHTLSATATDTIGQTGNDNSNVIINNPSKTVHVGDLDGKRKLKASSWIAKAVVIVHDRSHKKIPNATVTGAWSDGVSGTGTCKTNSTGKCTIKLTNLSFSIPSVRFTVTNIKFSSSTYISSNNHDPESDSDGTTIFVTQN